MGGHEVHIHYNNHAMQETDEQIQGKIQRIELVKFNPWFFHMKTLELNSWYTLSGGAPTMATGALGAAFAYSYYAAKPRVPHPYVHFMRSTGRVLFGFTLGAAYGFMRFGDRQRLHNAYVAERLMRRYPESADVQESPLWKCKNVKAPHEFYRWV